MNKEIGRTVVFITRMLTTWCIIVICEGFNLEENAICNNNYIIEGRKSNGMNNLLMKILPNIAMPFLVQSIILPLVLGVMKLTLLNSLFLGKLGIFLWIINIIYKNNNPDGVLYSHAININHGNYSYQQGGYPNKQSDTYGRKSKKRKK
ncbi:uncharacterized protein LOC130447563 [Diorhabda sublineata]|uniref:uncharacterized protein LOC130447563 n=1 Tax=Diorhabda sublineata TaxID=1163346 RepID=UPI0024E08EB2|nr:uncharacterized protein LOC130447563 [Diorhabda sublineata]